MWLDEGRGLFFDRPWRREAAVFGQVRSGCVQNRQTLMNELEAMIVQTPETELVEVAQPDDDLGSPNIADENFNPGYWLQKPIFRR